MLSLALAAALRCADASAGAVAPNYLLPDMFPYVDANATSGFETLQNWQISGNQIRVRTLFANQGDGLFEIRGGAQVGPTRREFIQRVYIDTDFGPTFEDFVIGTTPIPQSGDPGIPGPYVNDPNVLFFEDFTTFSLHEAPVVDGAVTVGAEVSSNTKTSWRLSSNSNSLPGFVNPPEYNSTDQSIEQRISAGWADVYGAFSNGQFVDITGVPTGPLYWLRQTVDPENKILESDETNNAFEILIDLNNPGEAIMFGGNFVQPGDAAPPVPGDLTGDGQVAIDDWVAFKAGATVDLTGLNAADAYALGDLNLDGEHSLADAVLFRQLFDQANGEGAFAASQSLVPEPSAAMLLAAVVAVVAVGTVRPLRSVRRPALIGLAIAAFAVSATSRVASGQTTLFFEDFEVLPLQNSVSSSEIFRSNVWTDTTPAGWSRDTRATPTSGPDEFFGWTFVDKDWWIDTSGGQLRTQFTNATGTVAVADPDEYDDIGNIDPNLFDASLTTPVINVASAAPGTAVLRFDSSWRPEDLQEASLFARIDGGAPVEIFRWASSGVDFKPDATNDVITVGGGVSASGQTDYNFNLNPVGASTVQLIFDMPAAGNDWWWAIDNVELFIPPTLEVNTVTGEMTINGVSEVAGYEITSPSGSLDAAGWVDGNLDAQNLGSPTPMSADFNNDGVVNAIDYTIYRDNAGVSDEGDADGDSQTGPADYDLWAQQFGAAVGPGESWETLIAEDDQLLEFFLGGSSTFTSALIGTAYDTQQDARDVEFVYATSSGAELPGAVAYVGGQSASSSSVEDSASVPEPGSALLFAAGATLVAVIRRR